MELRQLRYFVAVARERNITRAAEQLRIAQPPLSRQIQQLEAELGTALLERGTRPLRLTASGRLFFEGATQVLDRVEELRSTMGRMRETERPRFSIGFVGSTLYGYLPEVIREYRAARPDTELTLLEMTTLEQMAALREGRIDVGFGRIEFDEARVRRTVLRQERLCAALPASHRLLQSRRPVRLADLADEPLVVYPKSPRPSYADQVLALYRDARLHPPAVLEVRELQTALGLVAAQAGLCIVPASIERLRRDNVDYRPLAEESAVSPIIMSTREGETSADVGLLLSIVRALYRRDGIAFGA